MRTDFEVHSRGRRPLYESAHGLAEENGVFEVSLPVLRSEVLGF